MTSDHFTFTVNKTDGTARTGEIRMPRGVIRTPAFMPVGTAATVKAMYPDQVKALGADVVLGNTYHLMLRPGPSAWRAGRPAPVHELALSDPHRFRRLPGDVALGPAQNRRAGVTFQSHIDGSTHHMSPERSIEIQGLLGSDIQMQLDECVKLPCPDDVAEKAMRLSLRWAERCRVAFGEQPGKAMFGIVQGGAWSGCGSRAHGNS
jgi:queuine tRNA-ribosyltransferase